MFGAKRRPIFWITLLGGLSLLAGGYIGIFFDLFKSPNGIYMHADIAGANERLITILDFRSDGSVLIEERQQISTSSKTLEFRKSSYLLDWTSERGIVAFWVRNGSSEPKAKWKRVDAFGDVNTDLRFDKQDLIEIGGAQRRFRKTL